MPRSKRTFASIQRLPSKRWQVKYTDPTGRRRSAPHTFETRINAEAYVVALRRRIDADQWDASDEDPKEHITFGAYAARWLANRQVSGRPLKARTRAHYQQILDAHLVPVFGARQLGAIKPKDVRAWYESTLADRPTHAVARIQPVAHDHGVRGQRGIDRREPRADRRCRPRETSSSDPARQHRRARLCSPKRCPSGCG